MRRATTTLAALAVLAACGGEPDPIADEADGGSSTSSEEGGSAPSAPTGGASSEGGGGATSGDGGSGGTGGGAQAIGLDCSNAQDTLLCDDFETGSLDTSLWSTVEQNGGSVAVDDSLVLDGGYALHITLPSAGGAEGALRAKDALFPLPDNSLWGRAYIHLGPEVPDTHSKAITARGELEGAQAQYRLDSNGGDFNSRYTTPYINENVQHGGLRKFGYEVPKESWLCIEWHFDGAKGEMRYWFDGVAADSMTVLESEDPPWTAPAFDRFEIGWRTYQAGKSANSYDIHYDAIVLDDERVGCPM